MAYWPYVPADDRYEELGLLHDKINNLELNRWQWVSKVEQSNDDFDVQLLVNGDGELVAWVTNMSWVDPRSGTVALPYLDTPYAVSLASGGQRDR